MNRALCLLVCFSELAPQENCPVRPRLLLSFNSRRLNAFVEIHLCALWVWCPLLTALDPVKF